MEINNKLSNISNASIETQNVNNKEKQKNINTINNEINNISNNVENPINREILDKLVKEVNDKYKIVNKEFSYDIHDKTNRVTVKIKNAETGDVIKEIPSEESLDLAAKIMEMAGLLIDEKS